jgi:uncharacterized membrane protein
LSWITTIFAITTCLITLPAAAYVGPGVGLSAIGSLIALIGAIVVAIFGFLWYPLKRLMRKKQKPVKADKIEN